MEAIEELLEGGAVLRGGDQGGFFVAGAVDGKEGFRRAGGVVDLFAELEGDDGVLSAMDDQDGGANGLEAGSSVELRMNEQAEAGEEPEDLAGDAGGGREGGFENDASELVMGSKVGGDGSSKGLTEGDEGIRVEALRCDQILICGLGVKIDAGFAGFAFAVTVAAVLEGEDVGGQIVEEFVGGGAIGHVGGIAMEGEEGEFGLGMRNPPGMELDAIGSDEPNVLNGQRTRVPVAFEARGIVGEKDEP